MNKEAGTDSNKWLSLTSRGRTYPCSLTSEVSNCIKKLGGKSYNERKRERKKIFKMTYHEDIQEML